MVKVFIKTFGCSLNQGDSEALAGILSKKGFLITSEYSDADVIVINSCTVKNAAEAKLFKEIRKAESRKKKIVVAGCVAQAQQDLLKSKLKNYSVIGVTNLEEIVAAVEAALKGRVFQSLNKKKKSLKLPRIRHNKIISVIPLSEGCLGSCSYCKTKQARGELHSYPKNEVVDLCKNALADGCKELWLTSQDTGCYGLDIGTNIVPLLRDVLDLRGFFRVRLGMCNPQYALKYLEDFAEIFQHPKMFRFFHVPIQSGNNRILGLMNRKYSKEDFYSVVSVIRRSVPDITFSTDIIVGFPSETEIEFEESVDLVKSLKPDVLNISRYWARPGTKAAGLKQFSGGFIKKRSEILHKLFHKISLENNKKWIGWRGEVLVDEVGKNNVMLGRNDSYKQVVVKKAKLGKRVKVKVNSVTSFDLRT